MKREDIQCLKDILAYVSRIEEITKESSLEEVEEDWVLQDALIREMEKIAGIVKEDLSDEARKGIEEAPNIAGMRDILAYKYRGGIDLKLLWGTAERDLPKLKSNVEEIIELEKA